MGVHCALVNYENDFHQLQAPPIILNDFVSLTKDDKQRLANATTTSYNNVDVFTNEPSCEGGHLKGAFRRGEICQICLTKVEDPFNGRLESRVWIRSPKKVEKLVNPTLWGMLRTVLMRNGVNVLEWLTNRAYVPTAVVQEMTILTEAGFSRGYNNFIRNMVPILQHLIDAKTPSARKLQEIVAVIEKYHDCVFTTYLPLPNKVLLVIEKTSMAQYIEDVAAQLLEVIRTMSGIDMNIPVLNQTQRENRTAKAMCRLEEYYDTFNRTQLAKKTGWYRKQIFGSRNLWSSRAVISSRTGPHQYDEVVIGWGHAMTMFSIHIKNKLMWGETAMSPAEAAAFINAHVHEYHPVLERVLKELFDEAPGKRFAAIFVRNPSLTQSSVQNVFVIDFKRDPRDPTTSFSILDVNGYNADKEIRNH